MPNHQEVLDLLLEGNQRYVECRPTYPHQDEARRKQVASGQHPMAVILSCADSRVAPELIFDQGIGDIFVIRVAGNVAADPTVIASIEFAVSSFNTPLVLVMGHEACGAVKATLDGNPAPSKSLQGLIDAIRPAVDAARDMPGDSLDNAIVQNVRHTVAQLHQTGDIIPKYVAEHSVAIKGAVYSLQSGRVTMVDS